MEWPNFVYRMADHFDKSPSIKALLVLWFYINFIGGGIAFLVGLIVAFWKVVVS